jgi:hypothetical protein
MFASRRDKFALQPQHVFLAQAKVVLNVIALVIVRRYREQDE